jgi:hypothetical protein
MDGGGCDDRGLERRGHRAAAMELAAEQRE